MKASRKLNKLKSQAEIAWPSDCTHTFLFYYFFRFFLFFSVVVNIFKYPVEKYVSSGNFHRQFAIRKRMTEKSGRNF